MKAKGMELCYIVVVTLFVNEIHSSGVAPLLQLSSGHSMPGLGLGTWLGFAKKGGRVPVEDDSVQKAVEAAIDAGYRHIDTAHIYNTEAQVGRGVNNKIADGTVKREDLFITTKLWNDKHARAAVVPALRESLKKLNLDYVDLYLIHWPVGVFENGTYDPTDYVETWRGMAEARDLGLAKSIGVSNFNSQMIDRLLSLTNIKPASLQVEINFNLQQPALLKYCREQGIQVVGYTPLGSLLPGKAAPGAPAPRLDDPRLVALAAKYSKTVPQIALRYLVELGVVPIPKSVTKSRIHENIDIFDFQLSAEEKVELSKYDRNYRTIAVKNWADSPYYPFERE